MPTNPLTEDTITLAEALALETDHQAMIRYCLMLALCCATPQTPPSWAWQTHRALLALKRASGEEKSRA